MTEQQVAIDCGARIPPGWGKARRARRKTTVTIREPVGSESFSTAWGILSAEPGLDWVVVQQDGAAYPIKKTIFASTYEEAQPGRYRKKAISQLVQVPPGVVAVLTTREGDLEVRHPDYVVIGEEGEVYANGAQWVADNLQFL